MKTDLDKKWEPILYVGNEYFNQICEALQQEVDKITGITDEQLKAVASVGTISQREAELRATFEKLRFEKYQRNFALIPTRGRT